MRILSAYLYNSHCQPVANKLRVIVLHCYLNGMYIYIIPTKIDYIYICIPVYISYKNVLFCIFSAINK